MVRSQPDKHNDAYSQQRSVGHQRDDCRRQLHRRGRHGCHVRGLRRDRSVIDSNRDRDHGTYGVVTSEVVVCVAETCSNKVRFTVAVGPTFQNISSLAFEPSTGSLWVADRGTADKVIEIDSAGTVHTRTPVGPFESKITAADAAAGDCCGEAVSIGGETLIVGAPCDDDAGSFSGSAYVYVRDGANWTQQQKLVAADGAAIDQFGESVFVDGDTAIVGSPFPSSGGGAAYVFVRNGTVWSQQQKLVASDSAVDDEFGLSVALAGNTAIVGAPCNDHAGNCTGAAYVFVRSGTTWTQQQKLTASDAAAGDQFGISVSLSGDIAVAGAELDDDAGSSSGSSYVFVRSGTTWSQQQKLVANDATSNDRFGVAVSVSVETAVMGAYGDDSSRGSAYVFVRNGTSWSQQQKLTASDGNTSDRFGWSVAIEGGSIVVGAQGDDGFRGAAYLFLRSGTSWSEDQKLTATDGGANDLFGSSVSTHGDSVVAGAYEHPPGGASYVFRELVDEPFISIVSPGDGSGRIYFSSPTFRTSRRHLRAISGASAWRGEHRRGDVHEA